LTPGRGSAIMKCQGWGRGTVRLKGCSGLEQRRPSTGKACNIESEKESAVMNQGGTIIDLSQEIYNGMPVYPGHLKTVIFTHLSHEECKRQLGTGFSYETSGILICDHGPTHIDSVSHLSRAPDAPSVDEIPLAHCITPAICLDVSDVPRRRQDQGRAGALGAGHPPRRYRAVLHRPL
jgi:hypothetical protein